MDLSRSRMMEWDMKSRMRFFVVKYFCNSLIISLLVGIFSSAIAENSQSELWQQEVIEK